MTLSEGTTARSSDQCQRRYEELCNAATGNGRGVTVHACVRRDYVTVPSAENNRTGPGAVRLIVNFNFATQILHG